MALDYGVTQALKAFNSAERLRRWLAAHGNGRCFACASLLSFHSAGASVALAASFCPRCCGELLVGAVAFYGEYGNRLAETKVMADGAWGELELARLERGGNAALKKVLKRRPPAGHLWWRHFFSPAAAEYARRLDAVGGAVARRLVAKEWPGAEYAAALAGREGCFATETGGIGNERWRCPAWWRRWFRLKAPEPQNVFECAELGDAEGIAALVKAGKATPEDVDEMGWTALHYAARFGRDAALAALLRLAVSKRELAERGEMGGLGRTALQYAAERGSCGCLYQLLEAGASIEGTGGGARTPLYLAGFHGHMEAVELLLGYGADPAGLQEVDEEFVAKCRRRYRWRRLRKLYLIREKGTGASRADELLRALLARPPIMAHVAACL